MLESQMKFQLGLETVEAAVDYYKYFFFSFDWTKGWCQMKISP